MSESTIEEALGIDTLMIIRHGDKDYKVANWRMKHLNAVQARSLEVYRTESIKTLKAAKEAEILPPDEMRLALNEVLDKQGNWAAELMSPSGITYFACLLLQQNHPELTFEQVEEMLSLEHLQKITDVLVDALGIEPEDDDSPLEQAVESQ